MLSINLPSNLIFFLLVLPVRIIFKGTLFSDQMKLMTEILELIIRTLKHFEFPKFPKILNDYHFGTRWLIIQDIPDVIF